MYLFDFVTCLTVFYFVMLYVPDVNVNLLGGEIRLSEQHAEQHAEFQWLCLEY
jgi:hypothetical protein